MPPSLPQITLASKTKQTFQKARQVSSSSSPQSALEVLLQRASLKAEQVPDIVRGPGREKGKEGTSWSLKLPPETPAKGARVSVSKGSVCEHALCSVHVWDQGSDHDQG